MQFEILVLVKFEANAIRYSLLVKFEANAIR